MQLPTHFTEKILRVFGEKGRTWLNGLPDTLAHCQERWRLTDLRLCGQLSYNLICFAESPDYGPVALKLGVPHPEFFTEMKALALYAGRGICRCWDADQALGAMLLERLVPGEDLTTVADPETRFRTAADIIATLPVAPAEQAGFSTYAGWVTRAFARARAENKSPAALLSLADTAERFFREIDSADRPRLLLHGDLHHMNILRDESVGWKAIDPKGVVGAPCLEAGRFMQNEFGMFTPADRLDRLDQMTGIFAERLGESKRTIAMCGVVDYVLGTVWSVEENAPPAELDRGIEKCEAVLAYTRSL